MEVGKLARIRLCEMLEEAWVEPHEQDRLEFESRLKQLAGNLAEEVRNKPHSEVRPELPPLTEEAIWRQVIPSLLFRTPTLPEVKAR